MWPGLRPTCVPSFIFIRPTLWPQYTYVTDGTGQDRQTDRQWSDSIGQTVSQTVAQKLILSTYYININVSYKDMFDVSVVMHNNIKDDFTIH